MADTFKVLMDRELLRKALKGEPKVRLTERDFETVEAADPIGPNKVEVFTGSSQECDKYVRDLINPQPKAQHDQEKEGGREKIS